MRILLQKISRYLTEKNRKIILLTATLVLFSLFVILGITGSSLGWLKSYPGTNDIIELSGETKLIGFYRGIRCDEFLNHGVPNVLAQYYSEPKFSRFNANNGLGVRDFTVYHDSGIPVNHYITLFRPAVWGFYCMDLRRALAWYWWLPVFAGLFGIWFLLNTLCPGDTFRNYLLSLSVVASPLCASWSFWPLGNAAGLCFAAALLIWIVQSDSNIKRWLLSAVMMFCGLSSLMTLYMPRIYTVICLLLIVLIAYFIENKLFGKFKKMEILLPLAVFFILSLLVLGGWLFDAREAINALLNTQYPGLRRLNGGNSGIWSLVKGWLAPLTIYKVDYLNQCELQGPLTLFIPLLMIFIIRFQNLKTSCMAWGLIFFTLWTFWYQLIGLPAWLATITFWNRCNPPRCSFALSLAQVLFLAFLFTRMKSGSLLTDDWRNRILFALFALLCMGFLLSVDSSALFAGLYSVYSNRYIMVWLCCIALIFVLLTILLFSERRNLFLGMFLLIHLLPAGCFNPVCIAPIKIENKIQKWSSSFNDLKHDGRFLFLGNKNFNAVSAFCGGLKVLNGYFLYPDKELHALLFQDPEAARKSFRLSQYDFVPSVSVSERLEIFDDGSEHILVFINPNLYDFSKLPVDFVAILKDDHPTTLQNASLLLVYQGTELNFYRVLSAK